MPDSFCADCRGILNPKWAEIWIVCEECLEKRLAIWIQKDPAKNAPCL
jgi:hypothetical protein